jgi:hypothetical protein
LYEKFYEMMGDPYKPDTKVGDLWHLFRLPWTINEKQWIRNECKIIAEQQINSDFVNKLDLLIKFAKKRIEERNEKYNKEEEDSKKKTKYLGDTLNCNNKHSDSNSIFNDLRRDIDVSAVLLRFVPERPLKKDNKNFSKKWKKWNNSYFVDREHNIIIRNWSTYLQGTKEWMTIFDLIEAYTWISDWKWMLDWLEKEWFIKLNK